MKTVKEEFQVGKNNIGWVSNSFLKRFGDFPIASNSGRLESFILDKPMTDTEILAKIGDRYCSFANILEFLNDERALKNGCANIFYIWKNGEVFVVSVPWSADDRDWYVVAWRLDEGGLWHAGSQVLCPGNAVTSAPVTPDTQSLRALVAEIEANLSKLKSIIG